MSAITKLSRRNLAAHRTRYALAATSVAMGVGFFTASQLISDAFITMVPGSQSIRVLLGSFALIVFVASGFVIANSFTAAVAARTAELAMLRAIGTSTRQVFGSVVWEGLFLGLAGSALGLLAGTALGWGVVAAAIDAPLALPSLVVVALALGLGLVTDLIAIVIPARRATRVSPVAGLAAAETHQLDRIPRRRTVAGIIGILLAFGMVLAPLPGPGAVLVFVAGALLGFVALAMVAPHLVGPLSRGFAALAGRRPLLRIAARNLARSPRRVANTMMATALGATLFVGIVTVVASLAAEATNRGADAESMAPIYLMVFALTGMTIVVGLVGVVNTMVMAIQERGRELATLRATGMTAAQVRTGLLAESAFLGLVGALVGLAFGVLGAAILLAKLGSVALVVPWALVGLLAAGSLVLVLAATALPASRASRRSPVAALAAS